jgi:hypothetical protein
MTAYVVTSGEYSNYHIRFVTLDKAKAECYVNRFSSGDYGNKCEIEEFPCDEEVPQVLRFECTLWPNGRHEVAELARPSDQQREGVSKLEWDVWWLPEDTHKLSNCVIARGETPEEARKIAFDTLAAIKGKEAGI